MASSGKGFVQKLLERAHAPDTASQIFADKIQHRRLLLRPTSPTPDEVETAAAASAAGLDGRDARRRARRIKQEQRMARRRQLKPKPLSARERRRLGLYGVRGSEKDKTGMDENDKETKGNKRSKQKALHARSYATFLPLHRLWLGYIRELLGPHELRCGGQAAAAKLTAADFHGALVEVSRSACTGRVGIRGIVVRDTRFVFEIVTPDNHVKMVPKEGTFFRVEITVDDESEKLPEAQGPQGARELPQGMQQSPTVPKLVFEIIGTQFQHRAIDRASRKFKQHFYKEL